MKYQALVSLKDKSKKKLKCRLLQFLFGALRVNNNNRSFLQNTNRHLYCCILAEHL